MSATERNIVTRYLRSQAAQYVDRALAKTVEIMEKKDQNPDTVLRAVNIILDRAAGKPSQEVIMDVSDDDDMMIEFAEAQSSAREVMALPPPEEKKNEAEVIQLRPRKKKRARL